MTHPPAATAGPPATGAPAAARPLTDLWRDVRYGARALLRARAFAAVAALTLALGVGATTAMFSVLNAVLLRPLPFPAPDQLVRLYATNDQVPGGLMSLSAADVLALRDDRRALASVATFRTPADGFSFRGAGARAERVYGTRVSAGFFATLGVRPLLGRAFRPGDDADGAEPLVVLSEGFWRRRLGGDPRVVGRRLALDGRPATVVGVMPEAVWYPRRDRAEFWVNDTFAPPTRRGPFGWQAVGRVRAGTDAARRAAVLAQVAADVRARWPGGPARWSFAERPLAEQVAGGLRPALRVLMAAVVLVLLVACVNVTNLLLARATGRAHEVAVRAALGASRGRLVRQLLAECLLLAAAGGLGGVLLAAWGVRALVARAPDSLAALRDAGVSVDGRALAVAAAAALGSVLLSGLAPALLGAPGGGAPGAGGAGTAALRASARGATEAGGRRRLRNGLVAAEFALSLVLLVGAGLLLRSLAALHAVDVGVRPAGVVTASVALPKARYATPAQIVAFHDRLLEELRALPGVEAAGAGVGLPPDVFGSSTDFFVTRRPPPAGETPPSADQLAVDGGYFAALGIPLRAGRVFDARDAGPDAPPAVIVSASLARRYFPGEDPVGQRLNVGGPGDDNAYTIVGVVGDVRYAGVARTTTAALYQPFAQAPGSFSVVVRARPAPAQVASALGATVRRLDPELAVARVRTMGDLVDASVAADRFRTTLLGLFALVALGLAAVGIYGVTAYAVGRRARELGIRRALGARTRQVYALVLGEGLAVAGVGVAAGLVLALALTRALTRLLFGVSPVDALTFAAVPALLLVVAAAACLGPARRAARVAPAVTMRGD